MNAPDTKNASLLFSNARAHRGNGILGVGAAIIAAYLGVAVVLVNNYQSQSDETVVTARV